MSNLIKEYNRIKKSFPDCVVWMNVNGFIQTFNEDAKITSSICATEIVHREDEGYTVTGFRKSKLHVFLKSMKKQGERVAYLG